MLATICLMVFSVTPKSVMTQLPVSLMAMAAEVTSQSSFGAETWHSLSRSLAPLPFPAPELNIALRSNWLRRGGRSCLQLRRRLAASTSRVSVQPSSLGTRTSGAEPFDSQAKALCSMVDEASDATHPCTYLHTHTHVRSCCSIPQPCRIALIADAQSPQDLSRLDERRM
mmetsp:Transcript_13815/g.42055  ORF Transcript_13815/g.42055 Transcript_13815/m.42055 type:complete len:170 (-) Transcript_13815:412-921(-)